ncbi:MAG: hypothetical protein Q7R22_017030 [Verrucomicrobiota bacterium JB025]|nr:hypothetical protein [Verrucomicrobiota bacterium JB025]
MLAGTDPFDEPGPKYTYTSAGRLKTRTWANGVVTTYGYEAGMKVSTTYSGEDNGHTTPDLTFIYDANGMLDQVKRDGVLHADYDYSATDFTLTSEALNQDTTAAKTINRYYDSLLRPRSYKVGSDYTTAYGYGSGGRMTDVWDNPLLDSTGDPVDSEGDVLVAGDFTYGYATSSATLIGTITGPVHQVTNTWETTRDVLDSRENKDTISDPDVVVSNFDYTVNSIGQREGLATSGTAFSTAPQWD